MPLIHTSLPKPRRPRATARCLCGVLGLIAMVVATTACPDGTGEDAGPLDGGPRDGGFRPAMDLRYAPSVDVTAAPSPLSFGADDGFAVVHLPPAELDNNGTVDVELDIPGDARSVLMVFRGPDESIVIPTRLVGPDDEVFVSDVPPDDATESDVPLGRGFFAQLMSPARALPRDETGAYLIPSTPDLPFVPGRYFARIGAFSVADNVAAPLVGTIAVSALFDLRRAAFSGRLDVQVHLVTEEWTVASVQVDPLAIEAFSRWRQIYGQVGIDVNIAGYVQDNSDLSTVALTPETCDIGELGDLFATTAGDDETMLHLFVIDAFACEVGGFDIGRGIAGIAGGIPSTLPATGEVNSGVAVALSFFADAPDKMGAVMAHESGHALGLFHTQERPRPGVRNIFDIVSDTPEVEPGVLENLMYFLAQDETTLTDGQGEVMRRHPLVHPVQQ